MPHKKNILIIDDETDLCFLLKDYFVRKQYNVYLCHTLTEGKNLLEDIHPDVLFLDNNLPDGTGWDNAGNIATKYPGTYIILASAFHPSVPVMPANSRFMILEKPISLADLDKQLAVIKNN